MTDNFIAEQEQAWADIAKTISDPKLLLANGGTINGPASALGRTRILCRVLPELLKHYEVTSMLDAPCGDLTWIRHTNLSFLYSYIGFDINPQMIAQLRVNYSQYPNYTFACINLLTRTRVPKVDLILCRDFLYSLPTAYVVKVVKLFEASGSKYLLASTYPGATNLEYDQKPANVPNDAGSEGTNVPNDAESTGANVPYRWRGYTEHAYDLTEQPYNLRQIDRIPEIPAPRGVVSQEHELGLFEL